MIENQETVNGSDNEHGLELEDGKIKIKDECFLYRRILKEHIKEDGTVSSFAFGKKFKAERGLSFDLKNLTTIEKSIQNREKFRLRQLKVLFIRNLGFDCYHDPLKANPEKKLAENYAHVLVPIEGRVSRGKKRKMAAEASKQENVID